MVQLKSPWTTEMSVLISNIPTCALLFSTVFLKLPNLVAIFSRSLSNLFSRCCCALWQYVVSRKSVCSALLVVFAILYP